MNNKIYDVIIIGAGPAGLTTAIYTTREKLSTLVLEKAMCGGWLIYADLIENYPGFPEGINGPQLAQSFIKQAQRFGAQLLESKEVTNIEKKDGNITVYAAKGEYIAKSVIVTSGTMAMKLNIPGESEYTGKGVSYCATCDGPLFKDKAVLVVGGGNPACEEALFLTKFAKKVIMIYKQAELQASRILCEEIKNNKKIELLLNHEIISISGEKIVSSAVVKDLKNNKQDKLEISAVFILHVGFQSNSGFLKNLVELDDKAFIKTDDRMRTSIPGIFAAGDIRSGNLRQVVSACADGAKAAVSVREYLK